MNCPELSDAWLSMSIDDLVHTLAASMGENAPEGLAEMTNIGPMIVQIAQMIPMVAPTGEEIFNILKDYSSLIFKLHNSLMRNPQLYSISMMATSLMP